MHSDQGANYSSKIFKELCAMLELRKTRSSPYNPRGNGLVERFNRTLISMIKAYLKDEGKDWDKNLGCLAGAYRATVQESTGFTPNFLFLGREVRLPCHLMYDVPEEAGFDGYGDYVEGLKQRLDFAHRLAREHLGKAARRQKDLYDTKKQMYFYESGDLVWYTNPSSQLNMAPKLRKTYSGPAVILKKLNDLNYMVQLDAKKAMKIVHHNKLLAYKGSKRPPWIKTVLKNLKK